ncbi:ABC transporter ATP-binding protein [Clostridium sp. 19966]|uniref:ABC transporter ATP-binding protein n=1 Tax=Clostridium sp. 19966 TaxID=2768166 RepID=UPI0028DFDB6F|nr:ABC transporter ATP-binding protein [Clostridium sp. 19966]MDT8715702.1 ABC transporter ATP-binding protein [Clostridium sp. 19966]
MSELLKIKNLCKKYKSKIILDDISLQVSSGSIIGLLGPNGVGKTTLMKIIAGLLQDYKGEVLIDDHKPGIHTKSIVSYLPDKPYFNQWMKVQDVLDFFNDFYVDFDENKAKELVKLLNINLTDDVSKLSKGTYEKVQLITVMSRKAKLYVLDEPLGGVDPASRDVIIDTILKNYNEDSSVILSTQLIQDIERAFDRIIILKEGKVYLDDDVDSVRIKYGKSINEVFREVFRCF